MVKRYTLEPSKFCPGGWELNRAASGELVHSEDFDRMRRRLVALRCLERSKRRRAQDKLLSAEGDWQKADVFCRNSLKLRHLSIAIKRGEPLEYFRKLGSEK